MHPSSTKGVDGGGPTPIQPYASTYGQAYAGAYTAYQPPALLPHPSDLAYQAPPGYQLVPQQAHSSVYAPSITPSSQYSGAYKKEVVRNIQMKVHYVSVVRNIQMKVHYVSVVLITPVIQKI
jgi:hypothetical protein